MNQSTPTQDAAAIERDIRETQEEMSRTVDRIGGQLTPRNMLNALLDKAESNDIDARKLLDAARRNPLALAMIAGGAIWLISDNDARLPSFGGSGERTPADADPHHRDYIAHMERVEARDGEEAASYQRRRDLARANYFMIERGHEEDESAFRKRLDDAAEKFRSARHAWREHGSAAADTGRAAVGRAQQLYEGNPLVGGFIAAAAGAFLGSLLPATRAEEEALGSVGEKARDMAAEQTDRLMGKASEQKEKLVASAESALSDSAQDSSEDRSTRQASQPLPMVPN